MHLTFKAASGALLLGSLLFSGCNTPSANDLAEAVVEEALPGGDEGESFRSQMIARDFCSSAVRNAALQGEMDDCDRALIEDCADIVGMLSAPYLKALQGCVDGGSLPAKCIVDVTARLTPTAAQRDFAHDYCDECLLGMDGCEDVFYFGEEDKYGLGSILMPFNDELIQQVNDECTEGLMCSVDLPSCAQDILIHHIVPEKTILCVINPFKD